MIVSSNNSPVILLVSSAPMIRTVLEEALTRAQYNVVSVDGLGSAVDRLETIKPDLLIIRPYLTGIDGHDAAVYLRTKNPGMRVLIVSGYLDDDRVLRRAKLDSFELFPRPFTVAELLEKVEQVLAVPV